MAMLAVGAHHESCIVMAVLTVVHGLNAVGDARVTHSTAIANRQVCEARKAKFAGKVAVAFVAWKGQI